MNRVTKPSAAMLAAEVLRREIAEGMHPPRLPGTRVLAERLGVSAPTVATALAMLAGEGVVRSAGPRAAWRIVAEGAKADPAHLDRCFTLLLNDAPDRIADSSRRLLHQLRSRAERDGWEVDVRVLDYLHAKRPRKAWDETIPHEDGRPVIALYGRNALAEWAVRRKVRMLFLGGVADGHAVPILGVRSVFMAREALRRLTAHGHTRIVLPLCDRAESFKADLREATREAVEGAGAAYAPSYHNPESDYLEPGVVWRMLEAAFAKKPPTALLLLDWKEIVTVQCFLSRAGLRVPEDISLALLNDAEPAEWFVPKLCRFRFPLRRLVDIMMKWLEGGLPDMKTIRLSGDFVEGETIGPVPCR